MQTEPSSRLSRRATWCGIVAVLLLLPAVVAPAGGIVVGFVATVAVLVAMWRWPTGPVSLVAAVTSVAGASLLVDVIYLGAPGMALVWMPFELTALLVLLGRVVRRVAQNWVLAIASLTAAAAVLLPLRFTLHTSPPRGDASVVGAAVALFPVACAIGIGIYLRSLDNRRVNAVSKARRDQRLEVATDLHDFVAHEVTGIVLEVQAAQVAEYDEAEARTLFARIEQAGLRALESMDHTVQALRDPSATQEPVRARLYGLGDVHELVERFAATATMQVEIAMDNEVLGKLHRDADGTAYTVVLEALTNVRRHAPGAYRVRVRIVLAEGPAVEISVADDGDQSGAAATRLRGGTGLAGLHERVQALGGTLTAGVQDGGWCVHCVLPVPDLSGPRARLRSG